MHVERRDILRSFAGKAPLIHVLAGRKIPVQRRRDLATVLGATLACAGDNRSLPIALLAMRAMPALYSPLCSDGRTSKPSARAAARLVPLPLFPWCGEFP
jgi:hypothetical protein